MSAAPTLDQILPLAQRGWRLFPCRPRSKKPSIDAWPLLASADPATLHRWSLEHRDANWALATGPQSGVFVLDVDGRAGRRSLEVLEGEYGSLPPTLSSITGRDDGGEHRLYQYPSTEVRNSTSKLGAGLHIRGIGGYVVLPQSIHPSGRAYQWVDDAVPVAAASGWLPDLLSRNANARQTPLERSILQRGGRNDGLIRYAGALRRRGADLRELEHKLLEANQRRCQPPLPEREVRRIAVSAARYAIGGPDPLELAFREAAEKMHLSNEDRFAELCRCLQNARPGQEIALPLQRIAGLMDMHWTTLSEYRINAVKRGVLVPTAQYVAGKRAGRYIFKEPKTQKQINKPQAGGLPASTQGRAGGQAGRRDGVPLTSGLVRIGRPPSEDGHGAPVAGAAVPPSEDRSPSEHGAGRGLPCAAVCRDVGDKEAMIAEARARGESHGFTGIFLRGFIERELLLMRKWRDRCDPGGPVDARPWGGRFSRGTR